jgi:hypothetical protein
MRRSTSSRVSSSVIVTGIPEEILMPLYAATGELVFSWAIVETALNYWLAVIYQRAGGKHLKKGKEIPFGLTKKLRFLNHCFNQIEALEPFLKEAKSILSRAKIISRTRDMVVHGTISAYNAGKMEFLYVRVDLNKEKTLHKFTELWLPITKVLDDSGESIEIGREALDLAGRLLEAFLTEDEHQLFFSNLEG